VVSLQTVGIALRVAMLVTPAATAYLLTRRLPLMMGLAALLGAAAGVIGLYVSYYLGIASGAAIVLVCSAFFLLAVLFAPRRGVLMGRRARAESREAPSA
jgi:ABC-type Mn2+/Zn2+ transport system permease subunit